MGGPAIDRTVCTVVEDVVDGIKQGRWRCISRDRAARWGIPGTCVPSNSVPFFSFRSALISLLLRVLRKRV